MDRTLHKIQSINLQYYGRKKLRAFTDTEKDLYTDLYPKIKFDGSGDTLEIGFGMGDFLIRQALTFPHTQFIGVEPFKTGVVSL